MKRYTLGMGRFAMAAVLALGVALPLQAGVEVTTTGDRLDVTAAQAPVSEVLESLASKTRMKVVYEGPVPRTPVTVELRGRTPAQAVLGVLEGLGLNYVLVLAASGTEVETVIIVAAGARPASVPTLLPARSSRRDAPQAIQEEPTVETEEEAEVEENIPAVPHDAPKVDENAKAAPALVGPRNPTSAFPGSSPFAPGPLPLVTPSPFAPGPRPLAPGPPPLVTPSPSPNPPSSH